MHPGYLVGVFCVSSPAYNVLPFLPYKNALVAIGWVIGSAKYDSITHKAIL